MVSPGTPVGVMVGVRASGFGSNATAREGVKRSSVGSLRFARGETDIFGSTRAEETPQETTFNARRRSYGEQSRTNAPAVHEKLQRALASDREAHARDEQDVPERQQRAIEEEQHPEGHE